MSQCAECGATTDQLRSFLSGTQICHIPRAWHMIETINARFINEYFNS